MIIENFNRTTDLWIKELEQYDFIQLCAKPSANSWSLGQLYLHLVNETRYYIDQIKTCISTNDHSTEEPSSNAKTMFLNNDFPDEALEGAPGNAYIPQPDSKEQLINALLNLKTEMSKVAVMISESQFKGRTKHPGLSYFCADEWLQFAEMHFRHHLRQRKRIDSFLKTSGY
jgi:hypothetical protein